MRLYPSEESINKNYNEITDTISHRHRNRFVSEALNVCNSVYCQLKQGLNRSSWYVYSTTCVCVCVCVCQSAPHSSAEICNIPSVWPAIMNPTLNKKHCNVCSKFSSISPKDHHLKSHLSSRFISTVGKLSYKVHKHLPVHLLTYKCCQCLQARASNERLHLSDKVSLLCIRQTSYDFHHRVIIVYCSVPKIRA